MLTATLIAACCHASWNAITHWIPSKAASMTLVNLGGMLCAVPLILIAEPPSPRCWPYLAASTVIHVAYNALLMMSYRLGDFSQAYPLARGTSPLLVTVLAATFLGELPRPGQIGGVLLISAGLVCLAVWGKRDHPSRPAAILAAIATGVMIAGYTTVDGVGVRRSDSTLGYIGWLMLLEGIVIPLLVFGRRGTQLWRDIRPVWHIGLAGGALSVLAYGLVLWAQTRGALADIAALREASIIPGAVIGTVVFGEQFGRARVLATCVVVAGIWVLFVGSAQL